MGRVKIKHKKAKEKRYKGELLQILALQHIYATKIIQTNDGFVVLTRTDDDSDKILSKEISKQLKDKNYEPVTPQELKAKRSILLTRLDDYIYQNSEDDIRHEITQQNEWIKMDDIEGLYKFPKSNTIKITFHQINTAKNAQEKGILLFSMSVPPTQIKEETYTPITTCMRCYEMESHYTNQCPKEKDYKICSECGETGHTWHTCNNKNKKCINCGGDHRTLAMRCPERKKIIESKRKVTMTQSSQQNTYSDAIKKTTATYTLPDIQIEKETPTKILTCILHAHICNIGEPGTYNKILEDTLKANNLPPIVIPHVPNSKKIMEMTAVEQTRTTDTVTEKEVTPAQTESKVTETQEHTMEKEKVSGKELGVIIVTSKTQGWPKETFDEKHLKDYLEKDIYKWSYTNTQYEEDEIYYAIINNEINLQGCWNQVDDEIFKKLRSGVHRKPTPPPPKHRRQRKHST